MKRFIPAIIITLLAITVQKVWLSDPGITTPKCIAVVIDYRTLNNNDSYFRCFPSIEDKNALDLLKASNNQITGTAKYGDQVVCRVNNLPSQKTERCITMPPANAYWAVLVKHGGKWDYSKFAISKTVLHPGDSLGLVWAPGGKVKFPK